MACVRGTMKTDLNLWHPVTGKKLTLYAPIQRTHCLPKIVPQKTGWKIRRRRKALLSGPLLDRQQIKQLEDRAHCHN